MDILSLEHLFMMAPIILIALPFHEFAHGWVAFKMGDPTARNAGRLTLNPFKHLELIGVIMMFAAKIGWAKPVPINPTYFKNRRMGMILVSLAGPLSNLLLGFISMFIGGIAVKLVDAGVISVQSENAVQILVYIALFFYILVSVNINLAIFNLIPIPPLDGSRLISSFIPEEAYYRFARYEQYIGLVFLALVVLVPNNFLGRLIGFFAAPIFRSMALVTETVLGINANNALWTIMQGVL